VTPRFPGAPAREPTEAEQPLVLVVDDNEKNLKLVRDVLRLAGFRTLEATSGAQALALAAEHLPQVILMDLRLPDMDGREAARRLAQAPRTAPIPVVALSSLPLDGRSDWYLAAGFAGYLEKPIQVAAFPQQIRSYCVGAGR
jgi:two-component system cell cycle response regulator DivK